jgi:tight adherence protein B
MSTLVLLPITIGLLLGGSWLAFYDPGRRKVRQRLRALASGRYTDQATAARAVVRLPRVRSDIPWLNTLLVRLALTRTLERLLEQANSPYGLGVFLLLSLFLFWIGVLLSPLVLPHVLLQRAGAVVLGLMPFLHLRYRKSQRIRQFEQQLPEALDLVARSLQAGQPFLVGMQMVGEEFTDPIGMEFNKTVDEINFGVGVPEALTSLAQRVDCPDLLFFVTSVIVQREVGGNLAEILAKTSQLIRQRFELQGRIQVLAAEGKLSAFILFTLPFALALVINFLNPGYLAVLFTDPVGQGMVTYASITMGMGALIIRKMIKIKV